MKRFCSSLFPVFYYLQIDAADREGGGHQIILYRKVFQLLPAPGIVFFIAVEKPALIVFGVILGRGGLSCVRVEETGFYGLGRQGAIGISDGVLLYFAILMLVVVSF